MPHNEKLTPKKKAFRVLFGQHPLTKFKDYRESERASETDMKDALSQMLSGKALGLGLETVNLMFRISGITRIDTHQIVRQRIGVTFSQQCTGDRFLTHNDALIEECIAKDDKLLNSVIQTSLNAKETYTLDRKSV